MIKHAWILAALAAAPGCGKDGGGTTVETVAKVDGTVTLAGAPAQVTGCTVVVKADGEQRRVVTELALDAGRALVLDDGYLWRDGATATRLDCARSTAQRRSGRAGDAAWSRGALELECDSPAGALVVDVTFDCGARSRPSNQVP